MSLLAESKEFTRRAILIGGFKLSLFSLLTGRLYYLQIVKGNDFDLMSENNRIRIIPLFPKRGIIYDENDKIIATNNRNFELLINTRNEDELLRTLDNLQNILGLARVDIDEILANISQTKKQRSFYIIKDLSWKEVVDIEFNKNKLPSANVIETTIRHYTFSESFCHILGYVSKFDKKLASPTTRSNLQEFRIGLTGLEKKFDKELSGQMGFDNIEINSKGRIIRKISRKEPEAGKDLKLTINVDLQEYLASLLKGQGGKNKEGGSGCLIDIETGNILAMVSVPNFDANLFVKGIDQASYTKLEQDVDAPFRDKTINGTYSPGSTFKLITALAGLDMGVINELTEFYCPGYFELGNKKYNCWDKHGHGKVNVLSAIAQSCNVFFYEVSLRVGVDKIAEYARKFGFGSITGIELENEQAGLVPDQAWKKQTLNKPWYTGETLTVGIGQSYVSTTPLQLCLMVAKVASGNLNLKPTLIKKLPSEEDEIEQASIDQIIAKAKEDQESYKEPLNIIRRGMQRAVENQNGTLKYYKSADEKYSFAGKTGTVQLVSKKTAEEQGTRKDTKNHSLFVGFAPVQNPKYAVSVVIEHGGQGSGLAGSVGSSLLKKTIKTYEALKPKEPEIPQPPQT